MAQWTDVTEMYTLAGTTQASYLGTGLSVADYNRDGLDDITVANSDGTVVAYRQLASGGYAEEYLIDGVAQGQGLVWFDVDGDDDLDDFKVWHHVLTSTQITALYNAGQ
mgnify:CR=1 FL=1